MMDQDEKTATYGYKNNDNVSFADARHFQLKILIRELVHIYFELKV